MVNSRKSKGRNGRKERKAAIAFSYLLVYSLLVYATNGLYAQQTGETPQLVVSIIVDQLRGDYLQYFSSTFGEKGFKRLINEGLMYHSIEFGFPNVGEAASIASIYTGTYPYYNGITGDYKYDFSKNKEVSIVADDDYLGNYTSDKLSPLAVLASTVGDELRIASRGKSEVYAIAPNAAGAIISGGKYANGVFWLDDYNGKWATSTYYKEMPWYIDRHNTYEAIGNYPDRIWTQSHSHYIGFPYSTRTTPFSYNFSKNDKDRYLKIKQTSLINTEITNLANKFLESTNLGVDASPDLLAVTYYAGDYKLGPNPEEYSYEIQDIYYRLDKELEKLFDVIDRKVGIKRTLIVLTSTGYYDSAVSLSSEFKPTDEFYPNRCTALLNMYLMAIYGQGDWVNTYYNHQIYLNKKLAEEKQIKWPELVQNAAEFVAQFSGVQDVTTAGQWMVDDTGRSADFRRGMNVKLSGDIFIELQPGWKTANETNLLVKEYDRKRAIMSPLFIFGSYIKKENIYRTIKATEIAPTLSYILRIRPPNACKDLPLPELIK
ncbi:MAG: alkaline phosphatase family protein [Dysgonamonadaceae bacterium]|jgi:hypothetical protein|nr:alkaline phosphatase family protein [Dysgonamonadaceae bacterium]